MSAEQGGSDVATESAERLAVAESEAAPARHEALKFKIAAKHGISEEDVALLLTATDEDTLIRQAQGLVDMRAQSPAGGGNYVAREGSVLGPPRSTKDHEMREFVRELFGP
jgi:hypothetical protein